MPTGDIVLPYIGQVHVLGLTLNETHALLEEKYKKILLDPQLSVTVTNMDARIEQIRRDLHTAPRGLSKLVNVRPDGYATFPLVGDFLLHLSRSIRSMPCFRKNMKPICLACRRIFSCMNRPGR